MANIEYGEWDCGCKGFRLDDGETCTVWLTDPCDKNYNEPPVSLYQTSTDRAEGLRGKSFTPAKPESIRWMFGELALLIQDGHKLRTIKGVLA